MNRQPALILFLLAITFVLGCSSGGDSPTEPSSQATLRAFIVTFDNESPIPNATVTAQGRSALSGADGKCAISGLSPGLTSVVTTAEGYSLVEARITLVPGDNAEFRIHMRPST